ncbi:GAMM1 protein [Boletus reticuloceps]|uniref:GAMM1 protein n=1 Tax=Boletus reticuloceps TaxID=495285 RepID=A0A8I3AD76_9AGAM|nr:GAMM1 protein [Boletus reticuloceps]
MSQTQPAVKKQRMDVKTIGTHDGTFHCDEALAVFLLRLTETYRAADVKRSRDPVVLDTCHIVVDVGAVYDESNQRFDHHQRDFQGVFGHGFTTKLSSAGLIYKHFGKDIIATQIGVEVDHPNVHVLWLKLYKEFIEGIDAIDNGISQYSSQEQPRYSNRTDLSSRISWLNPAWNEEFTPEVIDSCFANASRLTGDEFLGRLRYYANAWLPARDIVLATLSARCSEDSNGRILLFQRFVPWKEHLFQLEAELGIAGDGLPLYVVYPDETSGNWRVQAVPVSPDSFVSRKALPEEWRGHRDDYLSKLTGIDGCIFVHASGFIGGKL